MLYGPMLVAVEAVEAVLLVMGVIRDVGSKSQMTLER